MNRIMLCGAMAIALAAGGVAVAQPVTPGGWDLQRREGWLQDRIDRGVRDRSLTRVEARRVERQLQRIRMEQRHLRRSDGGALSPDDTARLEQRLDALSDHVRWARHNDVARPW